MDRWGKEEGKRHTTISEYVDLIFMYVYPLRVRKWLTSPPLTLHSLSVSLFPLSLFLNRIISLSHPILTFPITYRPILSFSSLLSPLSLTPSSPLLPLSLLSSPPPILYHPLPTDPYPSSYYSRPSPPTPPFPIPSLSYPPHPSLPLSPSLPTLFPQGA